ncbi:HAMP domain-containing histidine kinase [Streptomyces sp. LX-29]|uniref:sensor histidine kinase n=1 Tax=Streptomyces sp. LX-29 TaxID=2900152 RepID=UPI00240DDA61|nr:HAMP domain-containing sensor histidine kinase [Streptomyces sp. LX-29]WFB08760.1 HAMP domain-containing histidine kinase [Streptomyces sp. LX-29]
MIRRSRRLRRLPLRSRLALLTAVAVAVAVAASALACWVVTRDQLTDQLDSSLRDVQVDSLTVGRILSTCPGPGEEDGRSDQPDQTPPPTPGSYAVQLVLADGTRCPNPGTSRLAVADEDVAVALGRQEDALHDTRAEDGTRLRVYTYPFDRAGVAVSVARPLTEVRDSLDTLALVLAVVAGVGVLGAATAGLAVARAGLRPVDRLTDAVEHVARTEDLAVRIPAEGDDEIARLSRSFNAMTAALATSRDRQQQLIADAGHELRTPLTSLRTNIELLVRSEETGRALPSEDRRELLASVTAQMTELAALIGDLQELARPDTAPGSGPPRVVAVHEVARAALARARLRVRGGAGVTIDAALDDPWYVRAEPDALERVLVNLLDNAVKFSPEGGLVKVALKDGEFTVRDHGPGIPPDELPHVFERFWRSPSARSLPGSGLGLSIVARAVRAAGGEIALLPAPGGGTVARLRLPGAASPPPDAVPAPPDGERDARGSRGAGGAGGAHGADGGEVAGG